MVRNRVLLVVAAVLALAACGGDDGEGEGGASGASGASGGGGSGSGGSDSGSGGSSGGDSNDVGPDGICERIAAIQCAAQEDCCEAPEVEVAECMSDLLGGCSDLEAIAAEEIVGYDRAAVKAALDELEEAAGNCDPVLAVAAESFFSTFTGTRDAGEDCTPEGGANTTDVNAVGAALASCSNVATTACLPSDTDWTCTARAAAGGTCFTDLNCQDGLFCFKAPDAEGPFDGECVARKAAGEACLDANECTSFVCKERSCAAADDVQAVYCFED